MPTFFFLNFYQNNIVSNLADTFPGNDKFTFSSRKKAEFPRTGNDQRSDASGVAVEFDVCRTAKTPACAGVDNFFLFQITDSHGKTCVFFIIYAQNRRFMQVRLLTENRKIKYNEAIKIRQNQGGKRGEMSIL